jgi:hypothetical protein
MSHIKVKSRPGITEITKELQKPVKVPGEKRAPKVKQATKSSSYKVRPGRI